MSLPPFALDLARRNLGLDAQASLAVGKIERGGSDREFYRVRGGGAEPFIIIIYGRGRRENAHYAEVAAFLRAHQVAVPKVLFHDSDAAVIAMQDLGGRDLWSFRASPWDVRRVLYQSALREVHRFHSIMPAEVAAAQLTLEPAFDETLYCWEQEYFFDHCLGGIFAAQIDSAQISAVASLPVWDAISRELAKQPRVLVHRDFQSQNVLIVNEDAFLIDFQGMRPGLPHYDLASLLYDPYVNLTTAERVELFAFYQGIGRRRVLGGGELSFQRLFRLCAVQRLMQALGAFGNLGLKQGKTSFLRHVPAALMNLQEAVAMQPELAEFGAVLARLEPESMHVDEH